jgi:serine/threonine protein kinase/peptidoglycan hydrolase-like protein with peptidoglycan-binding domain
VREAGRQNVRGVLAAGTRLRNYELVSVLGHGGFGITYYARDTQLQREVAIKEYLPTSIAVREDSVVVLPRSTELSEEFISGRERFLDEARTLAKLSRAPAIVRVHDFLEANGTAYMVMALAHGKTLDHRLKDGGPLSQPIIGRLLYPLLDGLEQVHALGFLHRDIKPANIILDANDDPTLIDFGASRAAVAARSGELTAIFTPGYAAPEQFTSARQGPWTDIYGLSATLYHAITGKVPPSAFDRVVDDAYQPLCHLQPAGFSSRLLAGLDAGLTLRARDRPETIAQWRRIISGLETGSATVLQQPRTVPTQPRAESAPALAATSLQLDEVAAPGPQRGWRSWPKRQRALLWAGVSAAIVAVAGVSYLLFVSSKPVIEASALQSLTAAQLEQALAERRKADAAAAEKKRLEEEAQRQADADARAKQAADAELAKAQEQRRKAEEELAQLKEDMEIRRKAEAAQREQAAAAARRALEEAARRNKAETEMAALRQAEEEARQNAAADAAAKQAADEAAQRKIEAEAKALRQAEEEAQRKAAADAAAKQKADEALAKAQAERQRADEEAARQKAALEARQKADADEKAKAEANAKQKADAQAKAEAAAAEKRTAEATENSLRLSTIDRQHVQVALTSLGFDTRGSDGIFGPRSREMIAAWQSARGQSSTGYLTAAQQQALAREGAQAIRRFDEQQKGEEQKKKPDEEAKTSAATTADSSTPRDPRFFDGPWRRDRTARCQQAPDNVAFNGLTVRDGKFSYTSIGEHHQETCAVQINPDGSFKNHACLLQMEGRFSGDLLQLSYLSPSYGPCTVSARRGE